LRFSVIDCISSPSPQGALNEDAIGATCTAAWVIDGVTGVSNSPPLVAGLTDAAWLAEQLDNELRRVFEKKSINPIPALAEIEGTIRAKFAAISSGAERTAGEQPSAAFALTVLTDDIVHLMGIADCRIIFESKTGDVEEFNPSSVGQAEPLIIDEQRRLIAAYPNEDVWQRLKPFIRSFRELANLDAGYSVVHPTRSWSSRIKSRTQDAAEIRHLLVVSDGFYRLVDVFRATDIRGLLKRSLEGRLELLCSELRALEFEDGACSAYPRIKTCDDASAVLLRIV